MNDITRGSICWLHPTTDDPNQMGVALYVEQHQALFAMCDIDTRLAGHLDVIMTPAQTKLSHAIAVFSHVAQWVPLKRANPVGMISAEHCDEIENARMGIAPTSLPAGILLRDPLIEPRWAAIEQLARQFIRSLEVITEVPGGITSLADLSRAIDMLLAIRDKVDLDDNDVEMFTFGRYSLEDALGTNPEWLDDQTILAATNDLFGTELTPQLVSL